MKRIRSVGIVGGISYLATLEYYRLLIEKCKERASLDGLPEVVIYSLAFDRFKQLEDSGDREDYINYIGKAVQSLQSVGVDCIVLAANSPHSVLDELRSRYEICFLNVLESAFGGARSLNIRAALLLGNKYTMQGIYYKKFFNDKGIELTSPEPTDQDIIDSLISSFNPGKDSGKRVVNEIRSIVSRYAVDGVILGCMRLPILLGDISSIGIKVVNPLELHVRDIVSYIYGIENNHFEITCKIK